MIGRLRGTLAVKETDRVLIDVGGVGYEASVSLNTFHRLGEPGEEVELEVVTNMRENALELFAFADADEKAFFSVLRSVSGIGPRLALAILSGLPPSQLAEAVAGRDIARLVGISGVGRKTAERLLVELTDKVPTLSAAAEPSASGAESDAVAALVGLGYKRTDALRAVEAVRDDADGTVETLLRRALTRLA